MGTIDRMGHYQEGVDASIDPEQEFIRIAAILKKSSPLLGLLGLFFFIAPLICFVLPFFYVYFNFRVSRLLRITLWNRRYGTAIIGFSHYFGVVIVTELYFLIAYPGGSNSGGTGMVIGLIAMFLLFYVFVPIELLAIRYFYFHRNLNMKMAHKEKMVGWSFPLTGCFVMIVPFIYDGIEFLHNIDWPARLILFITIVYCSQLIFFFSLGDFYTGTCQISIPPEGSVSS